MDFIGNCNTCNLPKSRFAINCCYYPQVQAFRRCPTCVQRYLLYVNWWKDATARVGFHDRRSPNLYWMRRFINELQRPDGQWVQRCNRMRENGWPAEATIDWCVEEYRRYEMYCNGTPFAGYQPGPQFPINTLYPTPYRPDFQGTYRQNNPAYGYDNTYTKPPWYQTYPTPRTTRHRSTAKPGKPSEATDNTYQPPRTKRQRSTAKHGKPSEAYAKGYTEPTGQPSRPAPRVRLAQDEAMSDSDNEARLCFPPSSPSSGRHTSELATRQRPRSRRDYSRTVYRYTKIVEENHYFDFAPKNPFISVLAKLFGFGRNRN